jgi:hypothetical protein
MTDKNALVVKIKIEYLRLLLGLPLDGGIRVNNQEAAIRMIWYRYAHIIFHIACCRASPP